MLLKTSFQQHFCFVKGLPSHLKYLFLQQIFKNLVNTQLCQQ